MAGNRAVVYGGPRTVGIERLDFPDLVGPGGRKCDHGAILRVVTTTISGHDQHVYRGSSVAPEGTVLGHEITGEVIEVGRGVEVIKAGDLVSVSFNIACGRCRNCKERHTENCLGVDREVSSGVYGFNLGSWQGGQAEYHMVPYADFNLLRFPDRDRAMENLMGLAFLSGILPTGFHGCVTAGVGTGSTVYIAGAGPVGRATAATAHLLGASCIIVGDVDAARLAVVSGAGYEVADLTRDVPLADQIEAILGRRQVDSRVDCVGFGAHASGPASWEEEPEAAEQGRSGSDRAWIRSSRPTAGRRPAGGYNRQLTEAILQGRMNYLGDVMNVEVIPLDQAPEAYRQGDEGSPKKFVIDPHGSLNRTA